MSHPIDVGSVLGGRYKVTATVLTSHDQDLVLDGVDQVLNRAVSILVAGPGNADQVAQSAREVATGERPGNVQILDLGVSEATTYLITNHTSAADLLDLVVSSNPPYVEPFFTDTLGSEIFGQPRSQEPETYDGLYDEEEVDADYINYGRDQQASPGVAPAAQPVSPARVPSRPGTSPAAGAAAGAAAAGAAGVAAGAAGAGGAAAAASSKAKSPETAPQDATPHVTAPQPVQGGTSGSGAAISGPPAPAESPKVSLWSDDDYVPADDADRQASREGQSRSPPPWPVVAPRTVPRDSSPVRPGTRTPRRMTSTTARMTNPGASRAPCAGWWEVSWRRSSWSVWSLLSPISAVSSRPPRSPTPAAVPPPAPPGRLRQSRPLPEAPRRPPLRPPLRASHGWATLTSPPPTTATWSRPTTATPPATGPTWNSPLTDWGGFAPDGVPLVVKLESPAQVSSVTLSQLGASGGNISIFTNDRPSLDGAKQVGSNSFTSSDLTMPLQEPVDGAVRDCLHQEPAQAGSTEDALWIWAASGRDQGPVGDP